MREEEPPAGPEPAPPEEPQTSVHDEEVPPVPADDRRKEPAPSPPGDREA